MDPNDLIHAAPAIAKGAGALASAIPLTASEWPSVRCGYGTTRSEPLNGPFA
jgi:hypothetical protein